MTLRKPYVDVNGMMLPLPPGDTLPIQTIDTGEGSPVGVENSSGYYHFFDDFFLPNANTGGTNQLNTIIPGWGLEFNGNGSSITAEGDSGSAIGYVQLRSGIEALGIPAGSLMLRGHNINASNFDYELEIRLDQYTIDYSGILFTIGFDPSLYITTGGSTFNDQWYLFAAGNFHAVGAHNSGVWKKIKITHTKGTPNTLRYFYNDNLIGTITTSYQLTYNYLYAESRSVVDNNGLGDLDIDYISLKFKNINR